jgi:hypothetical protein
MKCSQWNEPRIFRMLRPGPPVVGHGTVATGSRREGSKYGIEEFIEIKYIAMAGL